MSCWSGSERDTYPPAYTKHEQYKRREERRRKLQVNVMIVAELMRNNGTIRELEEPILGRLNHYETLRAVRARGTRSMDLMLKHLPKTRSVPLSETKKKKKKDEDLSCDVLIAAEILDGGHVRNLYEYIRGPLMGGITIARAVRNQPSRPQPLQFFELFPPEFKSNLHAIPRMENFQQPAIETETIPAVQANAHSKGQSKKGKEKRVKEKKGKRTTGEIQNEAEWWMEQDDVIIDAHKASSASKTQTTNIELHELHNSVHNEATLPLPRGEPRHEERDDRSDTSDNIKDEVASDISEGPNDEIFINVSDNFILKARDPNDRHFTEIADVTETETADDITDGNHGDTPAWARNNFAYTDYQAVREKKQADAKHSQANNFYLLKSSGDERSSDAKKNTAQQKDQKNAELITSLRESRQFQREYRRSENLESKADSEGEHDESHPMRNEIAEKAKEMRERTLERERKEKEHESHIVVHKQEELAQVRGEENQPNTIERQQREDEYANQIVVDKNWKEVKNLKGDIVETQRERTPQNTLEHPRRDNEYENQVVIDKNRKEVKQVKNKVAKSEKTPQTNQESEIEIVRRKITSDENKLKNKNNNETKWKDINEEEQIKMKAEIAKRAQAIVERRASSLSEEHEDNSHDIEEKNINVRKMETVKTETEVKLDQPRTESPARVELKKAPADTTLQSHRSSMDSSDMDAQTIMFSPELPWEVYQDHKASNSDRPRRVDASGHPIVPPPPAFLPPPPPTPPPSPTPPSTPPTPVIHYQEDLNLDELLFPIYNLQSNTSQSDIEEAEIQVADKNYGARIIQPEFGTVHSTPDVARSVTPTNSNPRGEFRGGGEVRSLPKLKITMSTQTAGDTTRPVQDAEVLHTRNAQLELPSPQVSERSVVSQVSDRETRKMQTLPSQWYYQPMPTHAMSPRRFEREDFRHSAEQLTPWKGRPYRGPGGNYYFGSYDRFYGDGDRYYGDEEFPMAPFPAYDRPPSSVRRRREAPQPPPGQFISVIQLT